MNVNETFNKLKIKFIIKSFSQIFNVNYKNRHFEKMTQK